MDLSPTEDDQDTEIPLSMQSSVLLTHLPANATTALRTIQDTIDPSTQKVVIRFQALPGAPTPGAKWVAIKVSASQNFGSVVSFLRKKLNVGNDSSRAGESLFVYVNKVFAPGLDEGVGALWRCFKVEDELKVSYSLAPAFG
ncbi:hypothetical protein BT93_L5442 [Corymbia citriodora subsp. variegata]|uniref:Ubiquitin-like protein ATG12 n=1 Tax=Corymbia citriodora subsp. variegata TaxID=360336 RepID=A0A8T0CJA4_CORYI|nr:hypothetical protein BT93_L5442 [Corymbia citriodora subsp. variegata]